MVNDRTTAGALAGAVAGLIQQIYGSLAHYIGFTEKDFGDFAGTLIMSKAYQGIMSHVIQWLAHIGIGMLFGVIFVQIFKYTSSKYWQIKGIIYGFILWVLLTGIGTLFKMPMWNKTEPTTALSMFIGGLIYSVTMAYILKYLENKTDLI